MCVEVHVFKVCGKEAKKFFFKNTIKPNRRNRLLLRLIRERRKLRGRKRNES